MAKKKIGQFGNKPTPGTTDLFLIQDGSTGVYYNVSKAQLAAIIGGSQTLSQILTNGNKTGEQSITSNNTINRLDVLNALVSLTRTDAPGGSDYGFISDSYSTRLLHETRIDLIARVYATFDAVDYDEVVRFGQVSSLVNATKYYFTITGDTQTLADTPPSTATYFLNGLRCEVGGSAPYDILSIVGNIVTFNEDRTGDRFLAIY